MGSRLFFPTFRRHPIHRKPGHRDFLQIQLVVKHGKARGIPELLLVYITL
jgi:hypothetical protein